jgi:hypothetical protein
MTLCHRFTLGSDDDLKEERWHRGVTYKTGVRDSQRCGGQGGTSPANYNERSSDPVSVRLFLGALSPPFMVACEKQT